MEMQNGSIGAYPILMPLSILPAIVIQTHPIPAGSGVPVFTHRATSRNPAYLTDPHFVPLRVSHFPVTNPEIEVMKFLIGASRCCWLGLRGMVQCYDSKSTEAE